MSDKTKGTDYIRDTQIIDAAWAMVESLGWSLPEFEDAAIQKAAMAAAEQFIVALGDRRPVELPPLSGESKVVSIRKGKRDGVR